MSVKISVIITCYNYGEFIEETIDSVENQTFKQFEIIVVDDGSTDSHTHDVLKSLEAKGVTVIRQVNAGPSSARNSGIKVARGNYIVPLDADDLIAPTFLEKCNLVLDSDPEVSVVYTEVEYFGAKTGKMKLEPLSASAMVLNNCIVATAMYRRSVWETVGGYNEDMKICIEDWDFWIGCLENGLRFKLIPESLFFYRIKLISRNDAFLQDETIHFSAYCQMVNNHPAFFGENAVSLAKEIQRLRSLERLRGISVLKKINEFYLPILRFFKRISYRIKY